MALHGKIVVIKRNGQDGTEFPLTATCVFGRKPECDIRIQLPEVSKEHCRIELNENKEVILTNLSLVNPTRINGKVIQQSKRLNHGDVITVIERAFRFEYPPEPTPKKRREFTTVCETLQVLQDQQLKDPAGAQESEQKELSCLKDGTNTANLLSSKDQCIDNAEKEAFSTGLEQENPSEKESVSPFSELYQMIKQNFSTKSPWKPAGGIQLKTPTSRCESQKNVQGAVNVDECTAAPNECLLKSATPKCTHQSGKLSTMKTPEKTGSSLAVNSMSATTARKKAEDASQQVVSPAQQIPKKGRRSCQSRAQQPKTPVNLEDQPVTASQMKYPQRFSSEEVVKQIMSQDISAEVHDMNAEKALDGTKTRTSKGTNSESTPSQRVALTPVAQSGSPSSACRFSCDSAQACAKNTESSSCEVVSELSPTPKVPDGSRRASPRTAGKKLSMSDILCERESTAPSNGQNKGDKSSSGKKRKSGERSSSQPKRKRVSFGGQLSPELFDKRLPPNSPLRRGATPGRRSLSVLKKQQSLLRRASVIGLIQEVPADHSGSKSPRCPEKKTSTKAVSSRSRTPSPAKKSPNIKAKTPSPSRQRSSKAKPQALPENCEAEKSPNHKAQSTTVKSSLQNKRLSFSEAESFTSEKKKSSMPESQTPMSVSSENVATQPQSRGTPCGRKSLGTERKPSSKATSPDRKSLSVNDSLSGQTSTVRGRFSVSLIETPSPVTDKSVAASESIASEVSASVTPKVPLRRKSLKSSKKTPKSLQKNALEIIRHRQNGASRANLKVLSSWADIVKFGAARPQAGGVAKKQKTRGKAFKKAIIQKPKTPAQEIKEHFTTGHAASPATIVVGKAHLRTVMPAGCAPKLLPNVVLLKRNMKVNEDLTGVAEMFSTPVNLRQKTMEARVHHCPKTPQDVTGLTSAEVSVMKTPEETGEMFVSPLSVVSMIKQRSYNDEAVHRLFHDDQEFSFTCDDSLRRKSERLANANLHASETNPVQYTEQVAVIGRKIKTPKLKHEAVTPLTGVKRIIKTPKQKVHQVEDLRGIKMLLRTPKDPKVNEELSPVGVKKLFKTPKVKGQPVEDMIGMQRLMKTPKMKALPLICTTGMKRLMCTPKPKSKPVEDLVGVKRLMKTPKQKNEPVEDMVGVKRLMRTPRQKNEPVEDMVGLKRLMRTPRQKNEPVEDMVGVKRLLTTPKQKGKPVESKFGIAKLMKSPRQKAAATVEDYTGLQELMQEPVEYYVKADMVSENPSLSDSGNVLTCTEIISEQPVKLLKEVQSDDHKKMARRQPTETVDVIEETNTAVSSDSVLPNVRPKRRTKVSHGYSSLLKVEVNKDRVASSPKLPRGRKAKPVAELIKDQADRNLVQNVTNNLSKQCNEGETSTQVLSPKSVAPVEVSMKERRARKAAVICETVPASSPVRKIGRGKMAKKFGEQKVVVETIIKPESAEALPQSVPEVAEDQKPVNLSPGTKPNRGRKTKLGTKDGSSSEHSLDTGIGQQKDAKSDTLATELQPTAPVVKCRRGRLASTIVKHTEQSSLVEPPLKRTCRGANDFTLQTAIPPVPSSRPGRRRKVANSLDVVEGTTHVQPESSEECEMKSVKKTKGSRKTDKILRSHIVDVAVSTPSKEEETLLLLVEPSVSDDFAIEIPKKASMKRKATSQSKSNKANQASVEEAVDMKAKVGRNVSKKAVALSKEVHGETAQPLDVEMQKAASHPVKTRRGRVVKKGNPQVIEPPEPESKDAASVEGAARPLRKRGVSNLKSSQPETAVDVAVAKRGPKHKLGSEEMDKELPLDAESSVESSKTPSTSKWTRRKAPNAEVKSEANTDKRSRTSAKKAEKALDVQTENVSQPVTRGRKRAGQNVIPEPEPESSWKKSLDKDNSGLAESTAKASNPKTRGRGKSQAKPDAPSVTEARPVRCTRRK